MIRDKRKNAEYFQDYISYQIKRIEDKSNKLIMAGENVEKKERINESLLVFKVDLLIAEYSAGYDKDLLISVLNSLIDTAVEVKNADYESILIISSFMVSLSQNYKNNNLRECHSNLYKDKLLNCLWQFINKKEVVWEGDFIIPSIFNKLNDINILENKETILKDYLSDWYANRSQMDWFEADKGENNTYVGYWSFESAALSKIFELNEEVLSDIDFYPTF